MLYQGWPAWVFAMLALVPFLVAALLRYEARLSRRGGMPLIDLRLFAIPSFRRGVLVATLFFFTTSFYFLFGLYQQEGRGLDPLHTGLAIAPARWAIALSTLITRSSCTISAAVSAKSSSSDPKCTISGCCATSAASSSRSSLCRLTKRMRGSSRSGSMGASPIER